MQNWKKKAIQIIFLFTLIGCASAESNSLLLPITSEQLSGYYIKDQYEYEMFLRPEYQKQATNFNKQEASVSIKGWHWPWSTNGYSINTGLQYYEIGHFYSDNNLVKVIVYNDEVEPGPVTFNVQINSYDDSILLDALLLDFMYASEGRHFFSNFKIDSNRIIIDRYVLFIYEVPWCGGLEDRVYVENPTPKLYKKEEYQIKNGHFELIFASNILEIFN